MEVNNNPDNNGMLYFVVGILVIGLIGLGFYYAGPRDAKTIDSLTVEKTVDRPDTGTTDNTAPVNPTR
jgi:hypothetical protein